MEDSEHFEDMLRERGIKREWVNLAENGPDLVEDNDDGTRHFMKKIPEFENRWLRVIINTKVEGGRRVTAFFDRRLRRKHES